MIPKCRQFNYSTEEQVVGRWIDGKKLYRKSIVKEISLEKGDTKIAHNISNLDICVNVSAFDQTGTRFPSLGDANSLTFGSVIRSVDKSNILIRVINDNWSLRKWYFILEYTKTTD